LVKLTNLKGLVDASPEEVAKLRLTYFNAGVGWNLEKLEADVAKLEEAAKATPSSASKEPPKENWVLPPGEAGEWDSSDDESEKPFVHLKHYVEGFVASATFDGTRPGMVFKRGDTGVGYYPDLAAPKADAGVASLTAQVAELMPAASAPATSID
tara:strand:+ start:1096 stop:1560 length:465 start_codon:yes stop_codon:yes gene_type:complete